MENYLEQYILYLRINLKKSGNTVKAYRTDLEKLDKYLRGHGIADVSKVTFTDLNAYILSMERKRSAPATVSRAVSTLKSYFTWLFRMKFIDDDPSLKLKAPKAARMVPKIITVDEMDRLLSMPDAATVRGIRDKAMLELMYATGMRVSEMINLRVCDVNLLMRTVTADRRTDDGQTEGGKTEGGRPRIIPFGSHAAEALKLYIESARPELIRGENGFLFMNMTGSRMTRQGFWKIIKHYGDMAGLGDRLTANTFRHSFAAHMIQNGADLRSVQEILGHSDISATQVYSYFADSKTGSVYEKAHPRK